MNTILENDSTVNADLDTDLSDTFAPSDEEARWAAETFNADTDDFDVEEFALEPIDADELKRVAERLAEQEAFDPSNEPDDQGIDEQAAIEAAWMDAYELGLFSTVVADYISRTTLVGHMP